MNLSGFLLTLKGSSRSGNFGHSGRPGKVGGSSTHLPIDLITLEKAESIAINKAGSKEKAEILLDKFKNIIKDTPVCIRVPVESIGKILDDQRFKTLHETGFSQGNSSSEMRKESEKRIFGENLQHPPLYGYLATGKNGFNPQVDSFGGVKVEFKDEVKNRTTITAGDSLASSYFRELAPTPLNNPGIGSISKSIYSSGNRLSIDGYVEAQIHDSLTTKDIKKVYILNSHKGESFEITKKLDKLSIPYEFQEEFKD